MQHRIWRRRIEGGWRGISQRVEERDELQTSQEEKPNKKKGKTRSVNLTEADEEEIVDIIREQEAHLI